MNQLAPKTQVAVRHPAHWPRVPHRNLCADDPDVGRQGRGGEYQSLDPVAIVGDLARQGEPFVADREPQIARRASLQKDVLFPGLMQHEPVDIGPAGDGGKVLDPVGAVALSPEIDVVSGPVTQEVRPVRR